MGKKAWWKGQTGHLVVEVVGLAPEAGLETWARPQLAACSLSIACQHFV